MCSSKKLGEAVFSKLIDLLILRWLTRSFSLLRRHCEPIEFMSNTFYSEAQYFPLLEVYLHFGGLWAYYSLHINLERSWARMTFARCLFTQYEDHVANLSTISPLQMGSKLTQLTFEAAPGPGKRLVKGYSTFLQVHLRELAIAIASGCYFAPIGG